MGDSISKKMNVSFIDHLCLSKYSFSFISFCILFIFGSDLNFKMGDKRKEDNRKIENEFAIRNLS